MSDAPAVVYLEADDEVTSVVRRIRTSDASRVILVAPGRSRATSSVVALRLLGRAAEAAGREVIAVGDALTRSLAAEAGLAAFATLDDARRAEDGGPGVSDATIAAPVQAPIRVVRGAETTTVEPVVSAEEATVPIRVVPAAAEDDRPMRPRGALAEVMGIGGELLLAADAGAALLPAATVTLEPATVEVGPLPYVVEVANAERLSGTVEADATVTATGTFDELEPATGSVVLLNWTFFPVDVAAGTFVAAGEQAFATQADVTVPRGSLTADGRIRAGSVGVDVVAAAPGPAANVDAEAIDTVVNPNVDARLRGFPENPERRVTNPEPTSGGIDETGTEITQADVDAAVDALERTLNGRMAEAVAAAAGERIAIQPDLGEVEVDGLDDLVGTRDEAEASIHGTLAWEAFAADRAEVEEAARSRMLDDPGAAPAGHELLADSVSVNVQEANVEDGILRIDVTATARAAATVDRDEVLQRIVGRTEVEAQAALADLGRATVELWPGWVASVPESGWRVDIQVVSP